jgi:hypothetical protein
MAGVAVRIVDHSQALGREGVGENTFDGLGNLHARDSADR